MIIVRALFFFLPADLFNVLYFEDTFFIMLIDHVETSGLITSSFSEAFIVIS